MLAKTSLLHRSCCLIAFEVSVLITLFLPKLLKDPFSTRFAAAPNQNSSTDLR